MVQKTSKTTGYLLSCHFVSIYTCSDMLTNPLAPLAEHSWVLARTNLVSGHSLHSEYLQALPEEGALSRWSKFQIDLKWFPNPWGTLISSDWLKLALNWWRNEANMCPNLERIAFGTIKRDFLNHLLDDFKSDNTYITFRAGRIFYVISNLSQKGLVHLK